MSGQLHTQLVALNTLSLNPLRSYMSHPTYLLRCCFRAHSLIPMNSSQHVRNECSMTAIKRKTFRYGLNQLSLALRFYTSQTTYYFIKRTISLPLFNKQSHSTLHISTIATHIPSTHPRVARIPMKSLLTKRYQTVFEPELLLSVCSTWLSITV